MSQKKSLIYACVRCEAQYPKWVGRCSECGNWGTVKATAPGPHSEPDQALAKTPLPLSAVPRDSVTRFSSGLTELDRVLGGGIVPGSLVLFGGEPGIGKSTLILQIAALLKKPVLYISGEESGGQIRMRLDRLGIAAPDVAFLNETHLETVCATITAAQPALTVIDSIQTLYSTDLPAEPGSVNQVRAATVKLLEVAKQNQTAICIIGHITKEGIVAGPKTLEHLVDTVLYLEGDRYHAYRIVRTIKNRFGSTSEIGVFEMTSSGMREVKNPAALFLLERRTAAPGSCACPVLEGSRIFLAEVQSLVTKTSFGYPQRKSQGIDTNRLNLLIAVLQKRLRLPLEQFDIHVNVAGGLKVTEPAVDLAVCLSIISAHANTTLGSHLAAFGEIGLNGEIRPVAQAQKRINEAAQLGFTAVLAPAGAASQAPLIRIIELSNIMDALSHISGPKHRSKTE